MSEVQKPRELLPLAEFLEKEIFVRASHIDKSPSTSIHDVSTNIEAKVGELIVALLKYPDADCPSYEVLLGRLQWAMVEKMDSDSKLKSWVSDSVEFVLDSTDEDKNWKLSEYEFEQVHELEHSPACFRTLTQRIAG